MRYVRVEREAYAITVIGGEGNLSAAYGPGLVLVEHGTWLVGETVVLGAGEGATLSGQVFVSGSGLIAIVEPYMDWCESPGRVERVETVVHQKPWGFEKEVTGSDVIQLKRLHVSQGARTSLQYHEYKDEVQVHLDGTILQIPAKQKHRVGDNDRAYDYFEGSTHHPDDVVRLEDDYGRVTT